MRKIKENLQYLLDIFALEKKMIVFLSIEAVLSAILSFVCILAPKYLLDAVQKFGTLGDIALTILLVCAGYLLCDVLLACTRKNLKISQQLFEDKLIVKIMEKMTTMRYEALESSSVQDDISMVKNLTSEGMFSSIISNVFLVLSNLISLFGITYILFQLPWYIVLMLIAVVMANSFARTKSQNADHDFMMKTRGINRKVDYVAGLLSNYVYGKEIRSYQLSPYIAEKYTMLRNQFYKTRRSLAPSYIGAGGMSAITGFIQRVVVFLALIRQYAAGLSFGDVSSLLVATEQYAALLSKTIQVMKMLQLQFANLEVFRRILDGSPEKEHPEAVHPCPEQIRSIEFCNVSFQYPGQQDCVLEDISFTMEPGKKYAIVGVNGAGKSTLVKLLMRVYRPTQGAIRINGADIQSFDEEEYRCLIAAVFQDFALFSLSISDNLCLEDRQIDTGALASTLSATGFDRVIDELPNGLDTFLNRDYEENGVSLSLGEQQLLAISRAVLRDAPMLIMDEPTAALSPLAEAELYRLIQSVSKQKTVIFISHRLASTRFCDEIIFLKNGSILEKGTHDSLIKQKKEYAQLFYMQADSFQKKGGETCVKKSVIWASSSDSPGKIISRLARSFCWKRSIPRLCLSVCST